MQQNHSLTAQTNIGKLLTHMQTQKPCSAEFCVYGEYLQKTSSLLCEDQIRKAFEWLSKVFRPHFSGNRKQQKIFKAL